MKILELINSEEVKGAEKLKEVKKLVKACRAEYGNADAEITPVKINTADGRVTVDLLTTDEKVAISVTEIKRSISQATAVSENVEGSLFDRAFEFAVSTNPILANIGIKSTSKY